MVTSQQQQQEVQTQKSTTTTMMMMSSENLISLISLMGFDCVRNEVVGDDVSEEEETDCEYDGMMKKMMKVRSGETWGNHYSPIMTPSSSSSRSKKKKSEISWSSWMNSEWENE